jgi:O-antigen ligase
MTPKRTRRGTHLEILTVLCVGTAFLLPVYGKIVPSLIALMVLNWLVDLRFLKSFRGIYRDPVRLLILASAFFYLIYLAGMINSVNLAYGWFDLEVKLSLFIFPLIFVTYFADIDWNALLKKVLAAFVAGSLVSTLILLGIAAWRTFAEHAEGAFFYTGLSWIHHPSYLAMYFTFCTAIVAYWMFRPEERIVKMTPRFLLILIAWFSVMVVLLSSKAGILSLAMVFVLIAAYLFFVEKKRGQGLLLAVILLAALYGTVRLMPVSSARFSNMESALAKGDSVSKSSTESNSERVGVWKSAVHAIQRNPWSGVGTGDVKDELMKEYGAEKNTAALKSHLNAHNQYLQTTLALGIPGLLLLLALIVMPAMLAWGKRDYLFLSFLLIFAFNISVESMLEVQAGVVWFAFLYTLQLTRLLRP